jgi:hypothetical protein
MMTKWPNQAFKEHVSQLHTFLAKMENAAHGQSNWFCHIYSTTNIITPISLIFLNHISSNLHAAWNTLNQLNCKLFYPSNELTYPLVTEYTKVQSDHANTRKRQSTVVETKKVNTYCTTERFGTAFKKHEGLQHFLPTLTSGPMLFNILLYME